MHTLLRVLTFRVQHTIHATLSSRSFTCARDIQMPPKKPKRASTADWTWVKTEVFRTEDITRRDRRRAAGLEDASGQPSGSQCPLRYNVEPVKQAILEHGLGLDTIKEGEGEEEGKEGVANGGSLCTPKRCREWHRCYNHIGAEEVI